MSAAETIRELTLPVVLISANGLICLALYNRLAAVTSRLRAFCREKFEMRMHLAKLSDEKPSSPRLREHLSSRIEVLELQRVAILRRAIHLRNALMLLLSAIIGMLVSSLLLGLVHEFSFHPGIPLTAFVVGTLAMIGGIMLAIGELAITIEPVLAENLAEISGDQLELQTQPSRNNETINPPHFVQDLAVDELPELEPEV